MRKKLLILMVLMTMTFTAACSDEGDYYDGFRTAEDLEGEKGEAIPAGAKYTKKTTNKTYVAGENMPETAGAGDVYECGDYVYTMKVDGWSVTLNKKADKTKESYEDILEIVAGYPCIDLTELYKGCANMTVSPKIPSSVKVMNNTFYECTALAEAPELPANVEDIQYLFYGCTSLVKPPVIPETVTSLKYTFHGCTSLTEAPAIPEAVTSMLYAFNGCTNLTKAPKIPSKLKIMGFAFGDCVNLVQAPDSVPDTVTDMSGTFKNCVKLTTVPKIPASVDYLTDTFNGCTGLTGTIVIDAKASNRAGCFRLVNFKAQGLEVTGSSAVLDKLVATGIVE